MLDKTYRIAALVKDLAPQVDLSGEDLETAIRAAELCKADLATKMVVEMTSLQGLMGRYYALASGEKPAVAQAIFEHYLPRTTGDSIPSSRAGLVVGLVDRLDSLAGLFAADLAPSGNKDPFAQRRTALGLVQNLVEWELDLDLRLALQKAAAHLPVALGEQKQQAVLDFIVDRMRNSLVEGGARYDVVDAVLAVQGVNPALATKAVKELEAWVAREDWSTILPAFARCVRITRDLKETFVVDEKALVEPAETQLYAAFLRTREQVNATTSVNEFLQAFLPMIPAVNRFFDEVLVMAEDAKVRQNRLGLLQGIAALAGNAADMSRLEGF